MSDIRDLLAECRLNVAANEGELQAAIAETLDRFGIEFERERSLPGGDRIDFLAGDVGIEIKTDGSTASVTRQLDRYAGHDSIASLLLITTRSKHRVISGALRGKPVDVLWVHAL